MTDIYPKELALASDHADFQSNYLDLDIMIKNDKFHTKLFDKRDAFNFQNVNFPDLSGNIPNKHSYGVFVSQLIDMQDVVVMLLISRIARKHSLIS